MLDTIPAREDRPLVHILSPFDPLVIQRASACHLFFGYEAPLRSLCRRPGACWAISALPVLAGDEIVAAIDLKADRQARKLVMKTVDLAGEEEARRHEKRRSRRPWGPSAFPAGQHAGGRRLTPARRDSRTGLSVARYEAVARARRKRREADLPGLGGAGAGRTGRVPR